MESKTIHLTGKLKKLCGNNETVTVGAHNAAMAIRGLCALYGDKVKKHIRENSWHVMYGEDNDENSISEEELTMLRSEQDIYFVPFVEGAGRFGQIILGAILIIAGVFLYPSYPMIGSALISTGVGMILQSFFAPDIPSQRERPDERASFIYNGATQTSEQGAAVPLIFGRCRTGSVVLSAGLDVEEMQNYQSPPNPNPGSPPPGGGGIEPPDMPPLIVP